MEGIPKTLGAEIRFTWLVILLSGIALAVGPGTESWLFCVAVCFFCGGSLIWLPLLYWTRRNDRRGLARLYAAEGGGECWAHWTYEPRMWSEYARVAYAHAQSDQRGRWRGVLVILGVALPATVFRYWSRSHHDGLPAPVWEAFGVMFAVLAVWILLEPWRLYRKMLRTTPEVRIGPHGFYQRGRYLGFGKRYTLAGLEYQPGEWPELIFKLLVRQRYGASIDAVRVVPADVRVLVPGDRQADALALVERFRQQIPGLETGWTRTTRIE